MWKYIDGIAINYGGMGFLNKEGSQSKNIESLSGAAARTGDLGNEKVLKKYETARSIGVL